MTAVVAQKSTEKSVRDFGRRWEISDWRGRKSENISSLVYNGKIKREFL